MSEKRPKCKICGKHHWLSEPHVYPVTMSYGGDGDTFTSVSDGPVIDLGVISIPSVTNPAASVTKPKGGRPKRYETAAERQRAYRERKR